MRDIDDCITGCTVNTVVCELVGGVVVTTWWEVPGAMACKIKLGAVVVDRMAVPDGELDASWNGMNRGNVVVEKCEKILL